MIFFSLPIVVTNQISVRVVAEYSGYSLQYIRWLLRNGKLAGLKIGHVWLIDKVAFEAYLEKAFRAIFSRNATEEIGERYLYYLKKSLLECYLLDQ